MPATLRVVLFREADRDDAYEACLGAAGYDPVSVPVLRYHAVNAEALRDALERPSAYAGLVVTSPRAVEALVDALGWLPSENARWHAKPVYAVGPATAGRLREAGFQPEGEAEGSAELLAEYIVQQSFEKALLFLCGNRRRDTLPDRLHAAGIDLEELCVYETHLREDLDPTMAEKAHWVVFFSPSGVEAVGRTGVALEGPLIAAIGATTAEAVRERWRVPDAIAEAPTPEALLDAVRKFEAW